MVKKEENLLLKMRPFFYCVSGAAVELCLKSCSILKLTGIPCMFPESEFCIVLISAWASIHKRQVSVLLCALVKP